MSRNQRHSRFFTIYQKSMYPPKVVKKPPFQQITQNSLTISRFGPQELETSNFTANCAQFANHHGESREIHAILANIYHSLFF